MNKDDLLNPKNFETHPLLPSGKWEGFYCYSFDNSQHVMNLDLDFKDGEVSGSGSDDVGGFNWKGNYNLDTMKITMYKFYATHLVLYKGDIDENGIWGTWSLPGFKGGFHIWPKKQKGNAEAMEMEKEVSEILEELFEELQLEETLTT